MAVREVLLTLLAARPNYGFRLHTELTIRLPQRASLNVGQTYTTLERLKKSGLVRLAGTNEDGLPLFDATDAGREAALNWLNGADGSADQVAETAERVMLLRSLEPPMVENWPSVAQLESAEQERWQKRSSLGAGDAFDLLQRTLALGVLDWLGQLAKRPPEYLPFSDERSRRGRPRRPSAHQQPADQTSVVADTIEP